MLISRIILFALLLGLVACSSGSEAPKPITPEQARAMEEYFDFDITFSDTIIKYKTFENQLELDFGKTTEKRWNVAVVWQDENGKKLCSTTIGLSYFLDDENKLYFEYPEEYMAVKDQVASFFVGAIPAGKSYISIYDQYNASLTSFIYRDIGNNMLKPTGKEWWPIYYIRHRVNYMTANTFSSEVANFVIDKEAAILRDIKYLTK